METGVKGYVFLGPEYKIYSNLENTVENKFSESNSAKTSDVFFTNRTYHLKREGKKVVITL